MKLCLYNSEYRIQYHETGWKWDGVAAADHFIDIYIPSLEFIKFAYIVRQGSKSYLIDNK